MSVNVSVIKRLEVIKTLIELDDEDSIHTQIDMLRSLNDEKLAEIIQILDEDDYERLHGAIENYINSFKSAELTPHQKEIFDDVVKNIHELIDKSHTFQNKSPQSHFLSLTGSAGVGKTFVVSKLVQHLSRETDYKFILTTPTHKSLSVAKYMITKACDVQIPSQTLHSFLNIKPEEDYIKGTISFKRNHHQFDIDVENKIDLLIVDESSMVGSDLMEFIAEDLVKDRFKAVLFVGDPYQLPPVGEKTIAVTELSKQFTLTEIVRQAKDSYIKVIANDVKECIKNKTYTSMNELFHHPLFPKHNIFHDMQGFLDDLTESKLWFSEEKMFLAFDNQSVDSNNRLLRTAYWQAKNIQPAEWVIEDEILVSDNSANTGFMNSEKIIVKKAIRKYDNDAEVYYYACTDQRGRTMNIVGPDDIDDLKKYFKRLADIASSFDKYTQKAERRSAWAKYFTRKRYFSDFKYPFASTIHKSQGSTYKVSYIDTKKLETLYSSGDFDLAFRLLYVAITRASQEVKVLF